MFTKLWARLCPDTTNQSQRMLRSIAALALFVFVAQTLLMVCLPLGGFLAHTAPDDAFYYLEIARRWGDTVWPTYDGQTTTTGFHPLWQLLLVPLAHVGSLWLFARVAIAISALAMLAATIQCTRLVARAEGAMPALVVGILLLGAAGTVRFGLNGMETPVGLLLLVSWCMEVTRPAPRIFIAGLLAGLTVLARIDMIWPLAMGHAWWLLRDRTKSRFWILSTTLATMVILPFVVWNFLETGHTGTISAATKLYVSEQFASESFGGKASLGFAGHAFRCFFNDLAGIVGAIGGRGFVYASLGIVTGEYPPSPDLRAHASTIVIGTVMLVALGLFFARNLKPSEMVLDSTASLRSFTMWVFVGGSLLHLAACSFLIPGHTGSWYWGLEIGAIAFLSARMFANFGRMRRALVAFGIANTAASVIIVFLTAVTLMNGGFDNRKSFGSAAVAVADYLDQVTVPGSIAGSRNGGIIGFAASHPVVNLDGLVNDWEFLEARRHGAVRSWIQRHHVRYYGDCVVPEKQAEYARSLGLSPDEVTTVFRIDGRVCEGFVWRIDGLASSISRDSSAATED